MVNVTCTDVVVVLEVVVVVVVTGFVVVITGAPPSLYTALIDTPSLTGTVISSDEVSLTVAPVTSQWSKL